MIQKSIKDIVLKKIGTIDKLSNFSTDPMETKNGWTITDSLENIITLSEDKPNMIEIDDVKVL